MVRLADLASRPGLLHLTDPQVRIRVGARPAQTRTIPPNATQTPTPAALTLTLTGLLTVPLRVQLASAPCSSLTTVERASLETVLYITHD